MVDRGVPGFPPLMGFFAKQMVRYSATHDGCYFMSSAAIIVTRLVLPATYKCHIVIGFFQSGKNQENQLAQCC